MPAKQVGPKITLAPRLPPLKRLNVRRPNEAAMANPCLGIMSSMLGCWASNGSTSETCTPLEESLRACMDIKRPAKIKKSEVNFHLNRFHPKIQGPTKKK